MRLDHLIQTMMPHDEKFYVFFNEAARNIVEAADILRRLPSLSPEEREPIIKQIKDIEHAGDEVTHNIFNELNSTFVTPFDPEDIHVLASSLDDILDHMDETARRFTLYKIGVCPPAILELMECLYSSAKEIETGMGLLKGFKHPKRLREVIERVNSLENAADVIFARGVGNLFENLSDPIEVIKFKEILEALETATDKCEDVADVLDTIILKHS